MSARRIVVRLAAFFAAYAAALSLVLLLKPAPPRRIMFAHSPPTRAFNVMQDLDVDAELISLDRESGRSYTRLKLRRSYVSPPARLWVRTYFFTAEGPARRVWSSDAVELRDTFDGPHDAASVTVAADCGWCADADAPRGGYFARVQVSTDTEESELPAGERFFDIKTAVPVVVHVERGAAPRRARG